MPPGCTEFTRIPEWPSSIAATFVMPRTANLLAVYARVLGRPMNPLVDEVLMMDPPPAAFIDGTTACMPRKHPTWFTLMTAM